MDYRLVGLLERIWGTGERLQVIGNIRIEHPPVNGYDFSYGSHKTPPL